MKQRKQISKFRLMLKRNLKCPFFGLLKRQKWQISGSKFFLRKQPIAGSPEKTLFNVLLLPLHE